MAFNNLQEFISAVESKGWLKTISAPVDWDLEISEITDRVSKSTNGAAGAGGPGLLFKQVKG